MTTRYKVDKQKVLYADECFQITGLCFYIQNRLGRFAKEKQFCDCFEARAKELGMPCRRELTAATTGNRIDFVLYDRILVEIKAKPFLNQDDFVQVQRYLKVLNLDLGLLVNFWAKSALPYRVLRRD
ncbi:MAG: GxxExxY protein [Patescibacteria group bacterium]